MLGFKYEDRTDPWDGACGVFSTVLAEAAIRFQAETMSETFPAAGPVKTKILGEETKDKEEASARVKADMNYELTERMVEYRPEHERMLYSLGLAGSAFKKVYYDPNLGRQAAIYISAEDVIVPYGASNIESAERVTHIMRKTKNELKKLQAAGFYRDIELGEPEAYHTDIEEKKAEEGGYSLSNDDRYAIYEVHADLLIDGVDDDDGIARPYVVTIERGSGEVLAVRRNYEEGDPLTLKRQHLRTDKQDEQHRHQARCASQLLEVAQASPLHAASLRRQSSWRQARPRRAPERPSRSPPEGQTLARVLLLLHLESSL